MARPRQHAPEALHAQFMAACDAWLRENPVHTLSLRALAREIGCAPSTLLKLYGSFNNLLQHVNLESLGRLRTVMEPLLVDTTEPEARLRALAQGYWKFAREDAHRWQLMFDLNNDGKISYEELVATTAD